MSSSYRLLSYQSMHGPRAGVLIGDQVFDAAMVSGKPHYVTVLGVLEEWALADALFLNLAQQPPRSDSRPLSSVTLLAPVLYPGQIFAAGANYQDHIAEMNRGGFATNTARQSGARPWFFSKTSRSAVIGHDAIRPLPPYSSRVDWELELAVVIGRTASRVCAADALAYVAGYTIANDLSARDHVFRDYAAADSPFRFDWVSHKGFDGACPMGPWIVPAHEIRDPQSLAMKLWVDEALMQDSNTHHMIFSVAELIEELSARLTLHPGDVILTGTPAGVGAGRNVFLRPGQRLRLWIEGIGELRHGFASASHSDT
jgi:2-keto-4-pentenoate hydratase/2-oxohepta-3-ene-1,7-dioic acid hydratase in catechol pathway